MAFFMPAAIALKNAAVRDFLISLTRLDFIQFVFELIPFG